AAAAARPRRRGRRAARAPRARGARRAGERRAARRLPLGRARLDRGHGRHPLRRRRAEHLRPRLRGARLRRARARQAPPHAHHLAVALSGGVRDLTPLIDEPLADPAWVPTFLLSRFARTHVKTVLVGEGADELFAGYPTYLGGGLAARYARLPAGVRRAVAAAAPALGAPQGNTTVRYLLRRFLEEADRPAAARHRAWTGCIDAARLAALATPGGPLAAPHEPAALPARSAIDALLALDLTGYLTDDFLPKL